jgi:hypothetical protein
MPIKWVITYADMKFLTKKLCSPKLERFLRDRGNGISKSAGGEGQNHLLTQKLH